MTSENQRSGVGEIMSDNKISLVSVCAITKKNFFIHDYQRGYRWNEQQITDLLNDINEFAKKEKNVGEFYCLQPLVVQEMSEGDKKKYELKTTETWYEVIDGQQRLTTIYLILLYLEYSKTGISKPPVQLKYKRETNEESDYLNCIVEKFRFENVDNSSIDHFHMTTACCIIKDWFENHETDKEMIHQTLSYEKQVVENGETHDKANNVRFIWYESQEEKPVEVFSRLNSGKIELTNGELIKALFLNRNEELDKEKRNEIAKEWDKIELALQNMCSKMFLSNKKWTCPTCIDFIFDLMCEQDTMGLEEILKGSGKKFKKEEIIGIDSRKTFRYFYEYFREKQDIDKCWEEVKKIFDAFDAWYNDIELYHYVGYLIVNKVKLTDLLENWKKCKFEENYLIDKIKEKIKKCSDLDTEYERGDVSNCRPILLLHNIQTVIDEEKGKKENRENWFPFNKYKEEKWDVEHIDSYTDNDLSDKDSQNEWLLNNFDTVKTKANKERICKFLNNDEAPDKDFIDLRKKLFPESPKRLEKDKEKNQIGNFALLDINTNRSYQNSIFATKCRIIDGKSRGKIIPLPKISKKGKEIFVELVKEKKTEKTFILPCTKKVFDLRKTYAPGSDPNYWTKEDSKGYKNDIKKRLSIFLEEEKSK